MTDPRSAIKARLYAIFGEDFANNHLHLIDKIEENPDDAAEMCSFVDRLIDDCADEVSIGHWGPSAVAMRMDDIFNAWLSDLRGENAGAIHFRLEEE